MCIQYIFINKKSTINPMICLSGSYQRSELCWSPLSLTRVTVTWMVIEQRPAFSKLSFLRRCFNNGPQSSPPKKRCTASPKKRMQ